MKEYKYLYRKMLDRDNILKAYKKLRRGKTKRREIQKIDANLDMEVAAMQKMILNTKPPEAETENPELAYKPHERTPKIIYEHGKQRRIYMPEIHEQWLHHIIVLILEPIVTATAYKYSCGSFPKRGAHYAKKQIEKWIRQGRGIRYFAKADIRHFYDSIRLKILMRELRIRIKDEWFLYIIELCLKGFKKGIPLGFYISQWLANYLLEPLDMFITKTLGFSIYVRYMDDMYFAADSKKRLHMALRAIRQFIGHRFRLRMKSNHQVCRFNYECRDKRIIGRPLDFMGFLFFRNRTTIRKRIMLMATWTAAKLQKVRSTGRRLYLKSVRGMLSFMGWFSCTDSYHCYEDYIKPFVKIKSLKNIVSKHDRRYNHDGLENGTLCIAA